MYKLVNMRRSTQLLDLPEELLGALLRQLDDGNSRLQVFMTSKRLATALLQHTPSSSGLAASYPSLTSLTLRSFQLSSTQLGRLLSHPALLPRLKHLDVCGTDILINVQPSSSPFTGSRLQQLRLGWGYWDFTPHLAPLAPHLTQLEVASAEINDSGFVGSLSRLAVAVGTLTCLQSLKFDLDDLEAGDWFLPLLVPVLASLPSLHTLLLLQDTVHGDQVDVLLAATQITHLQVYSISCLALSRVSAACSWRQLEVEEMDWLSAAHLPLHSLTHPLQLLGQRCWLQLNSTCLICKPSVPCSPVRASNSAMHAPNITRPTFVLSAAAPMHCQPCLTWSRTAGV
ncbi:hypothetical protein V8C86DRAFT_1709189 [Haematococcus lacustris]